MQPAVVAHRGASAQRAEHTLAAYQLAVEQQADGLECDVRLTRDGHLVCVHDRRIDRTSSGRGAVSSLTLAQLAGFDYGSWHSAPAVPADTPAALTGTPAALAGAPAALAGTPAALAEPTAVLAGGPGAPTGGPLGLTGLVTGPLALAEPPTTQVAEPPVQLAEPAGHPVAQLCGELPDTPAHRGLLTLETLLSLVVDSPTPITLFVETKHPVRFGGLVEARLVALLDRYGLARPRHKEESRVVVMSFSSRAVRRVRAYAPALPTVLLFSRLSPVRRDGSLPPWADLAGPDVNLLRGDPDYVARSAAKGHHTYCWTVDDPADVRLCQELGVRYVATNTPATTRRLLRPADTAPLAPPRPVGTPR